MLAIKVSTRSQRASQTLAALPITTSNTPITFTMHAMVGCQRPQLKMPPLAAYVAKAGIQVDGHSVAVLRQRNRPDP